MSAVSEAAAYKLRVSVTPMYMLCILMSLQKQLDLALDEKRALEATAKNLGTRLETEKMQGRLWRFACFWYKINKLIVRSLFFCRSKYEEATKFRSELMGRPEKGRDRENEFPLSSNRYP